MNDKIFLDEVLKEGSQKAFIRGQKTLRDVYEAVGFVI